MADDWKVGDLALCVRACPFGNDATRPGHAYSVTQIRINGVNWDGTRSTGLRFQGVARWGYSDSRRFVKVTPPEADEFDRETIELLNRAPAKEPAR